ncbi:MAG: hypothetical protein Q8L14_37460 [Myxococcales bacterium]|nr:hypothetical protein [Myxococcales bacterium]
MTSRLFILAALAFTACTQGTTSSPNGFIGANDMVLVDLLDGGALVGEGNVGVNRFLFVTSTNTNELRVLDLRVPTANGITRAGLNAPNPLETLSIPVLDRPTSLSLDTRYVEGVRRKGSLLYVTRQGGAEVSIVGVELSELREVRRVPMPAPVTAVANLMPDAVTSRLWVATFDGTNAAVLELTMPGAASELRKKTTASLVSSLTPRLQIRGASIIAMRAMPGLAGRTLAGRPFCADPSKPCLAVSTRGAAGAEGSTSLVDLTTLETAPLQFPGPVRLLSTSDGRLEGTGADEGAMAPPPGAIVYGVLDEEACGSFRCGGVAAVDARGAAGVDGFGVLRADGAPTQPLRWNDGLVRGLSFVAGGRVRLATATDGGLGAFPVLGLMTMSNGDIIFFDALTMSLLDQDTTAASLGAGRFSGSTTTWLEGPTISGGTAESAQLLATVKDGAFRAQTITVTWQGELTPTPGLTMPAGLSTSFSAPSVANRLAPGDLLTFSGQGCTTASITGVTGATVQFAPATTCAATNAAIRAGPSAPYVISGSVDGFLGRAASGSEFRSTSAPFARIAGVDVSAPGLVIPFGTAADTQPPATGVSWSFELVSGLAPLVSVIDPGLFTVTTTCPAQLQLPGAAVFEPVQGRVFIAYPSANVVSEFDPLKVIRGGIGPNEGVSCYR